MSFSEELAALFSRDIQSVLQELAAFPNDEMLWQTVPGVTNSAGNLALHLEGNLREYVGRQLGGVAYARRRDEEFSSSGLTRRELSARLEAVRELVAPVVAALDEQRLASLFPEDVLGRPLTVRQFLLHLLAHLNYHLGQIDYLRRTVTGASAIRLARL